MSAYGTFSECLLVAPGVVQPNSRGWATHDCTTLGGNSGSVVIDLATGRAVALHFAGAYVLENYAVPASTIQDYLRRQPWNESPADIRTGGNGEGSVGTAQTPPPPPPSAQAASVSITLPLTITVSIGSPIAADPTSSAGIATETVPIEEAVRRFAAAHRGDGIISVRSGLVIRGGEFTDTPCIHVVTHPERVAAVRARCPAIFLGHPVDVRAATIVEMIGGQDFVPSPRSPTTTTSGLAPNLALIRSTRTWMCFAASVLSAVGQCCRISSPMRGGGWSRQCTSSTPSTSPMLSKSGLATA